MRNSRENPEKKPAMAEPANLKASTFQESHVEAGGFSIKYMEAGRGDAVVILESISWGITRLQEALAQEYHVVVLELPGFGSSPANTRSSSVKELAGVAAQATAETIAGKCTLIGTSFGANAALWHTLQAPDQVEALVLISPTALLPMSDPAAGDPADMVRRVLAQPGTAALPKIAPEIAAKEQELMLRLGGGIHDAEAESRLPEIRCSTLVVFGSRDGLVGADAASIYRREIPNCHLSFIYDAGHLIVAERPEALINTVVDYVERRETFVVSRRSQVINP